VMIVCNGLVGVCILLGGLKFREQDFSVPGANLYLSVLVVLATAGSYLVSYVRARAQSLGFTCDGGLLARPERVLLTVAGLLLTPIHPGGLLAVVTILAIFTNFTAIQRVWIVWRQSRQTIEADRPVPPEPVRAKAEDLEVRPGPEPAGG